MNLIEKAGFSQLGYAKSAPLRNVNISLINSLGIQSMSKVNASLTQTRRPTLRTLDNGKTFEHIQHSAGASGANKVCKKARDQNGVQVARLVVRSAAPTLGSFKNSSQIVSSSRGVAIARQLSYKGFSGLVEQYGQSIVPRVHQRGYKLEIYQKEYPDGDLLDFLNGQKNESPKSVEQNTLKLTKLLADMHKVGIYHRDIKPENVLVKYNNVTREAELALTDFDNHYNSHAGSRADLGASVGTLVYFSPERAEEQHKAMLRQRNNVLEPVLCVKEKDLARSDVWAMGLTFYEYWFKKYPDALQPAMEANNSGAIFELRKLAHSRKELYDEPKNRSSIEHVIWEMLRVDPRQRITAEEAYRKISAVLAGRGQALSDSSTTAKISGRVH